MSNWEDHDILAKILTALDIVHIGNQGGHHFGRPYMTAYQLATKVHELNPQLAGDLGLSLGGKGTGSHNSLVQYLALELSRQIKRHGEAYPVEGAFMSNELVKDLRYNGPDGEVTSSLTESGFDLSLFRSRHPVPDQPAVAIVERR